MPSKSTFNPTFHKLLLRPQTPLQALAQKPDLNGLMARSSRLCSFLGFKALCSPCDCLCLMSNYLNPQYSAYLQSFFCYLNHAVRRFYRLSSQRTLFHTLLSWASRSFGSTSVHGCLTPSYQFPSLLYLASGYSLNCCWTSKIFGCLDLPNWANTW
uniref:Uncharacterized protein n=1 Tax=Opuntia streptacantha TaxID=393608 RepID=A0A7C8YL70_OPUST